LGAGAIEKEMKNEFISIMGLRLPFWPTATLACETTSIFLEGKIHRYDL
jgi:hypothetical protein